MGAALRSDCSNGARWRAAQWLENSAEQDVDAPVEKCYSMWEDREQIPQWMPWIRTVQVQSASRHVAGNSLQFAYASGETQECSLGSSVHMFFLRIVLRCRRNCFVLWQLQPSKCWLCMLLQGRVGAAGGPAAVEVDACDPAAQPGLGVQLAGAEPDAHAPPEDPLALRAGEWQPAPAAPQMARHRVRALALHVKHSLVTLVYPIYALARILSTRASAVIQACHHPYHLEQNAAVEVCLHAGNALWQPWPCPADQTLVFARGAAACAVKLAISYKVPGMTLTSVQSTRPVWQGSTGGSLGSGLDVANRGQIRFYRKGPAACAVKLTIAYEVPDILVPLAGALTPLVENILRTDLGRFAQLAAAQAAQQPEAAQGAAK